MDYLQDLKYHYRPKKGWINDPNGLVYFQGYYHVFYQHAPDYEIPGQQPIHWGHARTKDFLKWEELPIALYPDKDYDQSGCWSVTAVVKDDILYLVYASVIHGDKKIETVSKYRKQHGAVRLLILSRLPQQEPIRSAYTQRILLGIKRVCCPANMWLKKLL